ncbi:hypothetical protein GOBAR_DD09459 [Gossypium barbadense]|nr:hypothetical protein GOBAR_DD09459 [Gossypium barbadense]
MNSVWTNIEHDGEDGVIEEGNANLSIKRLVTETACPRCGGVAENVDHLCRLFCYSLWTIWTDRNKGLFEGKRSRGRDIDTWVSRYAKEIDECENSKLTKETVAIEWCPPNGSDIKVNFDAAFDEAQALSASKVVARNSSGEILASKTMISFKHIPRSTNIMAHELAREAIRNGTRTYLLGGLPERDAVDDGSYRRREPD